MKNLALSPATPNKTTGVSACTSFIWSFSSLPLLRGARGVLIFPKNYLQYIPSVIMPIIFKQTFSMRYFATLLLCTVLTASVYAQTVKRYVVGKDSTSGYYLALEPEQY